MTKQINFQFFSKFVGYKGLEVKKIGIVFALGFQAIQ